MIRENTICFQKIYTYVKTIFYNNFYETLSLVEILTWYYLVIRSAIYLHHHHS